MVFFFVSLIACLFVLYIVNKVWFAGARSAYLVVFFLLGGLVSLWTFLNGLSGIVSAQQIRILEPIWMVAVCCIPFLLLMYIMHFIHTPLVGNRHLTRLLVFLMLVDVVVLLTNPLHKLFYTSFTDSGRGVFGPLYWAHSFVSYAVLTVALILLIVYTVKNHRRQPYLIKFLIGVPWPFVLNLLYVFGPLSGNYDPTPLGFVIMFFTFGYYSIRLRLFNLKSAASANIFDTLAEGFVVVNNIGLIDAVNPYFLSTFPTVIEPENISIGELAEDMHAVVVNYRPDNLFERMTSSTLELDNGELSIRDQDGQTRILALQKSFITKNNQPAGYVLTLLDVSLYRRMENHNSALMRDIRVASEQMAVTSQQISSVSQNLAEGAGKQESGIKQFSTSIAQMKSMVEKTADTAKQATSDMTKAEWKMNECNNYMDQLGQAINDINQSAQSSNMVIKTIDDIAFQTNMLAINAFIEAARAGQYGKGFAVVAEEVRNLALTTAKSAKASSALIEDCSRCALEGAKIMQEAYESLARVKELSVQNTQTIAKITEATGVQLEVITAINEGMLDISHVTSHNAVIAQQWADSSQEMSSHSVTLRDISGQLHLREDNSEEQASGFAYKFNAAG